MSNGPSPSWQDLREQDSRDDLDRQHALALYGWVFALDNLAGENLWQALLMRIFIWFARIVCIMFWESLLATLVAAMAFSYAAFQYTRFDTIVTVGLVLIGLFFLLPVFCFVVVSLRMRLDYVMETATEDEIDTLHRKMGAFMDDVIKPLKFMSIMIFALIFAGFCFIVLH